MNQRANQYGAGSRSDLASIVEIEIERTLRQSGNRITEDRMRSAARIGAGLVEAILSLSERHQRILAHAEADPEAVASKFVRFLAADFAQSRERAAGESTEPMIRPLPDGQDVPRRADDFTTLLIEDWAGPVAGSTHLEETLHIPRSTLHRWQKRSEVIALRTGGRKHVFPLAQFIDGRPAPGIREVLAAIGHPRQAWSWLIRPSSDLDGIAPIELLRQDKVADVIRAAQTAGESGIGRP